MGYYIVLCFTINFEVMLQLMVCNYNYYGVYNMLLIIQRVNYEHFMVKNV